MSRRPLAALAVTGVAVVVGTFLPWLRSGARWRTSYELLGLVERLRVARGPGADLIRWWPLVPLLVTSAVVVAWWGARRVQLLFAFAAAASVMHVAVVVRRAAARIGMRVGPGLWLTAAAALVLVSCSAWLALRASPRSAGQEAESLPSAHADAR